MVKHNSIVWCVVITYVYPVRGRDTLRALAASFGMYNCATAISYGMRLREHLIIGGAAAVALYFYWGLWRALLFWGAAVLIDADHYWAYLWRSKFADWSGWRMFKFYDWLKLYYNDKRYLAFDLLHTFEFFLLVYILARFWDYDFFMTIFWAMLFHLFFDVVYLTYKGRPFIRAYSAIEYWLRKKSLLRKGISPDDFYREIFEKSKTAPN